MHVENHCLKKNFRELIMDLEYIGFPEWLKTKKCFFLFLQEIEDSSCTEMKHQTEEKPPTEIYTKLKHIRKNHDNLGSSDYVCIEIVQKEVTKTKVRPPTTRIIYMRWIWIIFNFLEQPITTMLIFRNNFESKLS